MKFLRFTVQNKEYSGILKDDEVYAIRGEIFNNNFEFTGEKFNLKQIKFLPPCQPPNIIALGLNYKEHAEEGWQEVPEYPVIFLKATTSLTGHLSPIILPKEAPDEVDYECELVIVIGKKCKNIEEREAKNYIFGYTCGNDVSARDCQLKKDKQWARGKSFDTFCPIGPYIETEIDPMNLTIRTILNGKIMQNSNTSKMIFNPYQIVSYLSKQMTLLSETIILTGTPSGVGFARKPPVFLREGDIIEIEIEKIGRLKNFVVKEK
ncbi:MAG: fumarylacetoacetate hydrolase family protein [Candidatus Ratteibacteria bacterium]